MDDSGGDSVRQGHISGRQLAFLLVYVMGTKVLYMFPTSMATKSGNSAWISLLVAAGTALFGAWGWVLWMKKTGPEGFVASLRRTCGRFLGDAIAVATLVIHLLITGWSMRLFVGGAVIGVVPDFPTEALIWLEVVGGLYPAWLGIEAVGRAAGAFFWPSLVSVVSVMFTLRNKFHIQNLAPIWGFGVTNTLWQGLLTSGAFGGIMTVAIVKSYIRKETAIGKKVAHGLLIAAAILIVGSVAVTGIFPYPMATRKVDPLGIMARSVYLGRFISRVESLFIFSWYFSTSIQASFLFVVCLTLVSHLCNTGTYRPFVPAIAILAAAIAGLPPNTLRAGQLIDRFVYTGYGNSMVALGWILYAIAAARGIADTSSSNGGDSANNEDSSQPEGQSRT